MIGALNVWSAQNFFTILTPKTQKEKIEGKSSVQFVWACLECHVSWNWIAILYRNNHSKSNFVVLLVYTAKFTGVL